MHFVESLTLCPINTGSARVFHDKLWNTLNDDILSTTIGRNIWQELQQQSNTAVWWPGNFSWPHSPACTGSMQWYARDQTLKTLRPGQNGRRFADNVFKCIFLSENVWILIRISLKFVPNGQMNNIPTLVRLPTHISVTRPPQWVKTLTISFNTT